MDSLPGILLLGAIILLVDLSSAAPTAKKDVPANMMIPKRLATGRQTEGGTGGSIKRKGNWKSHWETFVETKKYLRHECCDDWTYCEYSEYEEVARMAKRGGYKMPSLHQLACEWNEEGCPIKWIPGYGTEAARE